MFFYEEINNGIIDDQNAFVSHTTLAEWYVGVHEKKKKSKKHTQQIVVY